MKHIFIVSGLVAALMTLLVIVGFIDFNQEVSQGMTTGNSFYEQKEYEKAKEAYEGVIAKDANNPELHYNLGLVAYAMKDYEKAIEHFSQSKDTNMARGNTYYRQGSNLQDPKQQMQIYQQGLEQYLMGIKAQPGNIEIKYNYEYLKKLMDDQQKDQDQENQNEDNKNDEQEEQNEQNQNERNQEQENQDEQNQNEQNQDQENQDEDQEKQNQENQDKENQDQQNESQSGENQDQEKEEQNQDQQSQSGEDNEEADKTQQAIEQVLRMLEQQEKESLKNNQAVMNQGKEEENDW